MAGRKFLSFFMDKSWSPFTSDSNEQSTRRRLSVSRSGRFKEQKKKRPALEENTFNPVEKTGNEETTGEETSAVKSDWESAVEDIVAAASEHDTKNEEFERRQVALNKIRTQIHSEQKSTLP